MQLTAETYRSLVRSGVLQKFRIVVKQTDLLVSACSNLRDEAEDAVMKYRKHIEDYIIGHPYFGKSLVPVAYDTSAPDIVNKMIEASARAGVGPMASVAGAVAEFVGSDLLAYCDNIIVENGGDIFLRYDRPVEVLLLAETSEIGCLKVEVPPFRIPGGICTSSGTLGHSMSFGNADAVMVVGPSASFADAAATAIGNMVRHPDDIKKAIKKAQEMGLYGVVVIIMGQIGAWGDINFL